MTKLLDKRTLLAICGALVALRFAVLPFVESQISTREELILLTKKLEKFELLLANKEKIANLSKELEKAELSVSILAPKVDSNNSYRLEFQQRVNAIAQQRGVVVSSFQWLMEAPVANGHLNLDRARIQLTGTMPATAYFHADLESAFQNVQIRELSFVNQSIDGSVGSSSSSLNVLVDVATQQIVPGKVARRQETT
jgi:hypothetical protein